jgi:hypothetical protein
MGNISIPCTRIRYHAVVEEPVKDTVAFVEVTPELARQIVALGAYRVPSFTIPTFQTGNVQCAVDAGPADCPTCGFPLGTNACPTCAMHDTPPADDAAAVETLALAWKEYDEAGYHTSDGVTVDHGKRRWHYACDVHAPGVLRVVAALRAAVNKWHDEHDNEFERAENAETQIAALRAERDRDMTRLSEAAKERDQLKARVADLEAKLAGGAK